jgi:hypothetical protein
MDGSPTGVGLVDTDVHQALPDLLPYPVSGVTAGRQPV